MKLDQNKIDELNIQLSLNILPEDYAETVKKKLNDYRRKAEFKGFRKGMVPMGMIQKVYGEQALGDAINTIISEQLDSFINDNKLRILGEPILSEDCPKNEWVNGNEFNYKFDLGLSPEVNVEVSAADKLPIYKIEVSKKAKEELKANALRQAGDYVETEKAGEDDLLVVDFTQPAIENGHVAEGVNVYPRVIAEDLKAAFIGAKAGDVFQVNVNEAFTNETDRAAMLKVKKEQLASLDPNFQVTVVNVKTFASAEACQETYDKLFGEGAVTSDADFEKKLEEILTSNYEQEAQGRLNKDLRDMLLEKANISLPESFLKRWLFVANQGKVTMEEIEKDFNTFLEDFKWQLVRGNMLRKLELTVTEADINEAAESFVRYQYAQYGMAGLPDAMIQNAAKNILSDERQVRQLEESIEDSKVFEALKGMVTLSDKKISYDKFTALK